MSIEKKAKRFVSCEGYFDIPEIRPNEKVIWWYLEWRSAVGKGAATVAEIALDTGTNPQIVRKSLIFLQNTGVVALFKFLSPPKLW